MIPKSGNRFSDKIMLQTEDLSGSGYEAIVGLKSWG
jgi:hypothetical protein